MKVTRILIEGIGGIGGIVASALIKSGYAVTLITNNQEITDAINSDGLRIRRKNEEVRFFAQAHTSLSDLPVTTTYDIIFLIMKSNQVLQAATQSIPFLADNGYMATFQNGIVEFEVEDIVGKNKVLPVTVGFGGTMIEPGIYEKTSPGGFHIGELDGSKTRRIAELQNILQNVDEVVVSSNMIGVLWSKLAINCTINTLGAITGQTLGDLLSEKEMRDLFLQIYREVVNVAHAKSIRLQKVVSNPYRLYLPENANMLTCFIKDVILRVVGRKYRSVRSSTLQSLERGRKSEIDVLNGYVIKEASEYNVDVPANRAVTKVMKMIDRGELSYKPENLDLVLELINNS